MRLVIGLLAVSLWGQVAPGGGSGAFPPGGGSGAVASVSGAGSVTCSPTTGNVVCTGTGSGANTALSNLASPSINTSLLFQSAQSLGSVANPPQYLYFYGGGTYGTGSIQFTGAPTAARTVTFPDASGTVLESGSTASGDLSGTYPGPTVSKINNAAIPSGAPCLGSNSNSVGAQLIAGTGCIVSLASYSSLSAAVSTLGSSTQLTLMIPPGSNTVAASMTVPSNITLWFQGGGILSPALSQTLTIQGCIVAGNNQIFSGSGVVSFSGTTCLSVVNLKWWGATGNGTTNDTTNAQLAVYGSVSAGNGVLALYIPQGTYEVTDLNLADMRAGNCGVGGTAQCPSPARIYSDGGGSYYNAVFQCSGCGSNDYAVTLNSVNGVVLEGIRIDGGATSTVGSGGNCLDARWLATALSNAPNTHNTYRNLQLSNCYNPSSGVGYGGRFDRDENSEISNVVVEGPVANGLMCGICYVDPGGIPALFSSITISNDAYMQIDAQGASIVQSYLNSGLVVGGSTETNSNNIIQVTGGQIQANRGTGLVVNFQKYSGSAVAGENMVLSGVSLSPGGLAAGQSIFGGYFFSGVNMIGGSVKLGSGTTFGTISTPASGYPPNFTFDTLTFSGTIPTSTSNYSVTLRSVYSVNSGTIVGDVVTKPTTFNGLLTIGGFNTSAPSQVLAGSSYTQGYALNNLLNCENSYFNGSGFIYAATGYAECVRMNNGEINFSTAPSGAASATPAFVTGLKVTASTVALGGSISSTPGSTTGSTMIVNGTQVQVPSIKATTGTRFVCVDANGNLTSSATACAGT